MITRDAPPPTLERCENHYRGGHYTDALREIETLPDIERIEPAVVAMEVRLCMATGDWGRGLKRAYLCGKGRSSGPRSTSARRRRHSRRSACRCWRTLGLPRSSVGEPVPPIAPGGSVSLAAIFGGVDHRAGWLG